MFAIVDIGGFQERVEKGFRLRVPSIAAVAGEIVTLDKVLLVQDGTGPKVGTPLVQGMKVEAKVLSHGRGDKIRVSTFKKRKRQQRTVGHRQGYTEIEVTKISS